MRIRTTGGRGIIASLMSQRYCTNLHLLGPFCTARIGTGALDQEALLFEFTCDKQETPLKLWF
jgi:hypothetical protein